jgi:hemolysin III
MDAIVQGINLVLAIAGCVVLLTRAVPHAGARQVAALVVYAAGLLAMAACSALYGQGRGGPRHELYRRLDKAAIFLMIGGTYTPFILNDCSQANSLRFLVVIWTIALLGLLIVLVAPHRLERLSIPLYLLLGWSILSDPGLLASLPLQVTALLVAGGLFYTVGILFCRSRMPFQEAIWHGFVLAGAVCHYAAIAAISHRLPVASGN